MIKAMAFGTFDILHPGHLYFLRQARKHGDSLVVVLARDITVRQLKKELPVNSERQRASNLEAQHIADKIILGSTADKYKIIEQEKPDIICLGYDQKFFTALLEAELKKRKIRAKVVRIGPYREDIYKSSILKQQLFKSAP